MNHTVTNLTQQKKTPRINIHLDGKYFCSLTIDQVLEQKIKIGLELDGERKQQFKQLEIDGKVIDLCVRWGSLRPRTTLEFKQYARKKGFSSETSSMALERLKKLGYIDDRRMAEMLIQSRSTGRPSSKREVAAQLMKKGVDRSLIDELLADFSDKEKMNLQKLIEKKRRLQRFQDDTKLKEFLLRKGYRYSDIDELLA